MEKPKILVVDDNPLILSTLRRLLRSRGYEATLTKSGAEALEKAQKKDFDLVIVDLKMPEINGVETITRLRSLLKSNQRKPIPEMVITAYDSDETLAKVKDLNVATFLLKPFDMQELLQEIEKNVEEKRLLAVPKAKPPITVEKRKFIRVGLKLPADAELTDQENPAKRLTGIEITNISEDGAKIVSSRPLAAQLKIYIYLPPCYSGDPNKSKGIEVQAKQIWSSTTARKDKFFYGLYFMHIDEKDKILLRGIIKYEVEKSTRTGFFVPKPKLEIRREPHSCNMYAVDLTVGCENGCRYCHFSCLRQEEWKKKYPDCKSFPIPVDISPLYEITKLPESVVYLSPSSDAFAPAAKELTHELLEYMLPKGVIFTISTKCIIPDKTIDLFKKYPKQIEGIAVGLANMDNERNKALEPHCPPAQERLENIRRLKAIGCSIGARMDPMFPIIDDNDENLNKTIKALAEAGIEHLSGTYFFSFGRFLKELRAIPMLKESLKLIKEKSYPIGGVALSAPIDYKKTIYEKMNEICKKYGVKFSTCGCKQVGLREQGYSLICRNLDYYAKLKKAL